MTEGDASPSVFFRILRLEPAFAAPAPSFRDSLSILVSAASNRAGLAAHAMLSGQPWPVAAADRVESTLDPAGAQYATVRRYRLFADYRLLRRINAG
ncbi:MAG: hypothetical protein JNJ92_11550 [Altererythrobacter sp.]|nr:hypothetical protein [Altererythrobacter sp.]